MRQWDNRCDAWDSPPAWTSAGAVRNGAEAPVAPDAAPALANWKDFPTPTVGITLGRSLTRSGSRNKELLLPGVAIAIKEGLN